MPSGRSIVFCDPNVACLAHASQLPRADAEAVTLRACARVSERCSRSRALRAMAEFRLRRRIADAAITPPIKAPATPHETMSCPVKNSPPIGVRGWSHRCR